MVHETMEDAAKNLLSNKLLTGHVSVRPYWRRVHESTPVCEFSHYSYNLVCLYSESHVYIVDQYRKGLASDMTAQAMGH